MSPLTEQLKGQQEGEEHGGNWEGRGKLLAFGLWRRLVGRALAFITELVTSSPPAEASHEDVSFLREGLSRGDLMVLLPYSGWSHLRIVAFIILLSWCMGLRPLWVGKQ